MSPSFSSAGMGQQVFVGSPARPPSVAAVQACACCCYNPLGRHMLARLRAAVPRSICFPPAHPGAPAPAPAGWPPGPASSWWHDAGSRAWAEGTGQSAAWPRPATDPTQLRCLAGAPRGQGRQAPPHPPLPQLRGHLPPLRQPPARLPLPPPLLPQAEPLVLLTLPHLLLLPPHRRARLLGGSCSSAAARVWQPQGRQCTEPPEPLPPAAPVCWHALQGCIRSSWFSAAVVEIQLS